MLLPDGGWKPLAAVVALCLMVAACGGDDESALDKARENDPSADARAGQEKDVADAYEEFWRIRVDSENSVSIDADTYAGVAQGPAVERQNVRIQEYRSQDIVRVGQPSIDGIEVLISGDTAQVTACLDEDDWRAKREGKLLPIPEGKEGPQPVGAEVQRVEGAWLVTQLNDGEGRTCG